MLFLLILYTGNKASLAVKHKIHKSLEMRYCGVPLYLSISLARIISIQFCIVPIRSVLENTFSSLTPLAMAVLIFACSDFKSFTSDFILDISLINSPVR